MRKINYLMCCLMMLVASQVEAMDHYSKTLQGSSGLAIAGASVTVYNTGTTTKPTIYSDNGITPKSNPFTTGPDGVVDFYALNGVYDLVFSDPRYLFNANQTKGIVLFDMRDEAVTAFPASPFIGQIVSVKDDPSANACTSAGGSFVSVCYWNGSSWSVISGGGGGSGTVTSITAANGVETTTGSPITTTGTIRGAICKRTVTAATDTILSTDRGCFVVYDRATPIAVTVPQAGTTGFESKFFFVAVNIGVGEVTLTPTTSTINKAANVEIQENGGIAVISDGTNYIYNAGLGILTEKQGLTDAYTINRTIDGAVSQGTAVRIGSVSANAFVSIGRDPTTGIFITCEVGGVFNACNKEFSVSSGFFLNILDGSGNTLIHFEPNASTSNAQYGLGTKKAKMSFMVPLNPRGAATTALESIVTNQPKDYYLTVTDANTDAADFTFVVTPRMAGATTATVRLIGVSKNASPSGNIDFDCAMTTFTPGTDTYAAHSTTGEQTVLLTPATQSRPVATTSAAHTINGGALVAGDIVKGSCEVDATATTSAQMTDFRLEGMAVITLDVNSLSD
jgi:hypothetical protein